MYMNDELRAEIIAAIEAANPCSPEEVADMVLEVAETGGDWRAKLAECVANDADTEITEYTLEMRDDSGAEETVEIFDRERSTIRDECESWVNQGDWGIEGASVDVVWTICDADGNEVDTGCHTVDVEPDHDALILLAGGDVGCDHEWSSEGEGGCDENPGVWSTGGTSMTFRSHCIHCGIIRTEHHTGSQRNPGEHDTVEYEMPEAAE